MNRQLGVRPITLVGFSLGARMIYYALRELAQKKAYGIVQNVYLLGAPVTARESEWKQVRSVVSGRFVNGMYTHHLLSLFTVRLAPGLPAPCYVGWPTLDCRTASDRVQLQH